MLQLHHETHEGVRLHRNNRISKIRSNVNCIDMFYVLEIEKKNSRLPVVEAIFGKPGAAA